MKITLQLFQPKFKNKNQLVQYLFYIIIFFPIIGENVISVVLGETLSMISSIISCIYIFLCLISQEKIRFSKFSIIIIASAILHFLITFLLKPSSVILSNANNLITPYGLIAYSMMFLFIDLNINNKEELYILFKSMMSIMTISVFANLLLTGDLTLANNLAVFKEAISTGYTNSRTWLFGHRNMIFVHHLMWMLFSYMSYKFQRKSYDKLFLFQIAFTILIGIISWNSTMMLSSFVILILYIYRNNIFSKISIIHLFFVYLFLEISIIFIRIQKIFSFLIINILHRNLSFTGRTAIWDYYINQFISSNPINFLLGNFGITEISVNTHNMFLGLLSFTGLVGLILYFLTIIFSIAQLKKTSYSDTAKFVSIIIFAFLINSLTMEFYLQPLIALYFGFRIRKINQLVDEGGD